VTNALHGVPRLFQLWACKKIHDIAGTNLRLHKCDRNHSPLCPSCLDAQQSCAHVFICDEEDRVKCFQMSADHLHYWLQSVGTCDVLEKYIMRFVRARDGKSVMVCISGNHDPILQKLAQDQTGCGGLRKE